MIKALLLLLVLQVVPAGAAPMSTDEFERAQAQHAFGICTALPPGPGLAESADGRRGWVKSLIPGRHEFFVVGSGSVEVTVARLAAVDMVPKRAYWIVVHGPGVLEWKPPYGPRVPVPRTFLYPPS